MRKKVLVIALLCIFGAGSLCAWNTFRARAPAPAAAQPADGLPDMLKEAALYESRNDLIKARDTYQSALEKYPASKDIVKIQESLDDLNIKILFSPVITPDSVQYEVRKGDSLTKISKNYNTTIDLIARSNNLKDQKIALGEKLKVSGSKFSVGVSKSQNTLTLKSDGRILKIYRVSTGKDNSTPVGVFKITTRIVDPSWYVNNRVIPAGNPENILGSRWLGISIKGYGIHGTTEPESIGKQATAGCVRMRNTDVEELFTIVPIGTEVVIVD